jgi:hypothetical protein
MDADFSHDPSHLPEFLAAVQGADLVLGSRYRDGKVTVVNWPMTRLMLSYGANIYARAVTGLHLGDATGGFKCFRREVLAAIPLDQVRSNGYAFQIEMSFRAWRRGFRIAEIPIVFHDRTEVIEDVEAHCSRGHLDRRLRWWGITGRTQSHIFVIKQRMMRVDNNLRDIRSQDDLSGNDCVLRRRYVPLARVSTPEVIRSICNRRNGVGGDGLVVLEPVSASPGGDPFLEMQARIHSFNSDGTPADLCGNATLCSTALAAALGIAPADGMGLETPSGRIASRLTDGLPEIALPEVHAINPTAAIDLGSAPATHRWNSAPCDTL